MIFLDKQRFAELCEADRIMNAYDGDSIGTYNEKRLHRIFKRMVTDNAECYEVRQGRYISDVVCPGGITEIQTASFRPLEKKIKYYLENTVMDVTVICPVIAQKQIIRADKDTGEVLSSKRSPKKGSSIEALCELYHLRESFPSPRLTVLLPHIAAEEYRFSERVRYRKAEAYDNDLRPTELLGYTVLQSAEDCLALIPDVLKQKEFSALELTAATGIRNTRKRYYLLSFLEALGYIEKQKSGRRVTYSFTTQK